MVAGFVPTFLFVLTACSSNPSSTDAAKQFGNSYCEKLQSCFGSDFATAFPNGVGDCVQQVESRAQSNAQAACSQDELNACTTDISNMSCAASLSQSSMPTSCSKC
jgi:hypothetical protein